MTSSKQSKKPFYNFEEIFRKISEREITVKEARLLQKHISQNLNEIPLKSFKIVAGIDSAYSDKKVVTAIVFYDVFEKKVIFESYREDVVKFPYIPTLLFLREGPFHVKMIKETNFNADVYLIDAHGKAHPYKAGHASFVGYFSGKPTIGVAKSKLTGSEKWHNNEGDLILKNELIGKVIKVCDRKFYVSVGCNIDLESSVKVFNSCIVGCECYPLAKAHELCTRIAREIKNKNV